MATAWEGKERKRREIGRNGELPSLRAAEAPGFSEALVALSQGMPVDLLTFLHWQG